MVSKVFKTKQNGKKVKVLKQYETIVLCLDLDIPKKVFWHKEVDNKHLLKIENLEELKTSKQIQNTLF